MSRVLPARPAPALAALAGMVLCLLVGLAGPAAAGPWVDRTAGQLRDAPLYVNPSARPTLSLVDRERISARLALAGTPVFVAVLPAQALAEAGGNANDLASQVATSVGKPGPTWWSPGPRRSGQQHPRPGRGRRPGQVAFREHPELAAAIFDFIERVEDAAGTTPATAPPRSRRRARRTRAATPCSWSCWASPGWWRWAWGSP